MLLGAALGMVGLVVGARVVTASLLTASWRRVGELHRQWQQALGELHRQQRERRLVEQAREALRRREAALERRLLHWQAQVDRLERLRRQRRERQVRSGGLGGRRRPVRRPARMGCLPAA
ncbi:MAG: hypothetical protein AB1505_11625 [Candidatus Latescibacterota bacterium]